MSKKFKKKKENFVCEHCGLEVVGDGYTNHCPNCLWSKHVDVFPGDRAEKCGGLMEPVGLEIKNGREFIIHRCLVCGVVKKCKVLKEDNREKIIALSNSPLTT
jgi:rubrerythrin